MGNSYSVGLTGMNEKEYSTAVCVQGNLSWLGRVSEQTGFGESQTGKSYCDGQPEFIPSAKMNLVSCYI